ncbi:carbonic anhydrase-related protein 10-like isoform X2 [Dermatophagoides pteronyssinus]|uniref:carbonic anhydrase-related protein 10-like isoform X2 n=1 Tax=Dermatophagoides pteronyssinus TaxID=6956 RepID=UPI003F67869B
MSQFIKWPNTFCRAIIFFQFIRFIQADWESWWTYEGISGPDFWGRLNPRWSHCSKGQRQSPIDIDTSTLLYDPYLEPIKINGDYVRGQLVNTGRGISLLVDRSTTSSGDKHVTISDGPFSYQYTVSNITLHFGRENDRGSEHTIDGRRFPGELQLYAYNSQLYSNWSEAKREPNGLVAISIFIMVSGHPGQVVTLNQPNAALKQITGLLKNITKRGLSYTIESLSIMDLLPSSWKHYVTYEGSLTQPSCHETVQWVILNRPIYLSSYQFHMLRHSLKGDGHQDNFRPTQPRNKRSIRCNIVYENLGNSDRNVVDEQHHSSNTLMSTIQQDDEKLYLNNENLNRIERMVNDYMDNGINNNNNNNNNNNDERLNLDFNHHKSQKTIKLKQNTFVKRDLDYDDADDDDDDTGIVNEYNVQKLATLSSMTKDSNINNSNINNNNNNNENNDENGINSHQINRFEMNLLAIKDTKFCLPNQLRLYGYRANPRMIKEEL